MPRLRIVGVGLCLLLLALASHSPVRRNLGKLDRALREWVTHATDSARVLIRTEPGADDIVRGRLEHFGRHATVLSTSPALVVARVDEYALRALAADPHVQRVSADALVKSLGSALGQNALLATEGLIVKSGADWKLSTTYTGHNVGVAVIDSGVNNGEIDAITFFDATNAMKKVGKYDDFGHGTHVSGLLASNGNYSNFQYQGVASSVQLIEVKVLDAQGNGYTSDVINAINFVVQNRAALHVAVINLSLGHPVYESATTDPLVQAVENAVANGIVVVVSAGNFGGDLTTHDPEYAGITSPANAPDAITVGALDTLGTVSRADDQVAWYSSRGPTWYDGFQKPDILAPGSHLVSDVSTTSSLYASYSKGLIAVGDKKFLRLSGTSMAAPVVSGVVAAMIEASRANHGGAQLTPNAIKAILQYTALPLQNADVLTQGAGALNGAGAIALAVAIDPRVATGGSWLTAGVNPWTTIGTDTLMWSQRVVWGDRVVWGNQILTNDPAWALRVVWGDRVIWGNRVVWGNSTVWDDGNPSVWGSRVVWGDALIGETCGSRVVWGDLSSTVTPDHVVWGDLQSLSIAAASATWGNLERANGDLVAK
jgi:serine protease AprX